MNDNVSHEGQNPFLFEQGSRQHRNVYAYADENDEVAVSMDFEMANNTEAAEDQNTFVKQEDEQACCNDESASKDDRMIEDTSANDQQAQLGDHPNIVVDPSVEAQIIDNFHRLAAEIIVASKENKARPAWEIYGNLHEHFLYIENRAFFIVGDVRRGLMDTVLEMFNEDSPESLKHTDIVIRERSFQLWQFWARDNFSRLDNSSFAAMDDNDLKYCMAFAFDSLLPSCMSTPNSQTGFNAPDANMSMDAHDAITLQDTEASQSASEYPNEAEDGVVNMHYPQGPLSGQNLYNMSIHTCGEVPSCIQGPLDTVDQINMQASVEAPVPVAVHAQPSTQAVDKPRRKTAKAAAVNSGSNSNPPDGLYLPAKDDPMFGKNGPFRGIAYVLKAGKRSWVANPDYADKKVDSRVFGDNQIAVGKWWPAQMVACVNGGHGSWFSGITGDKNKGAHSIVKSGGTYDSLDEDQGDIIFYSGSGAHKCEDINPKNSDGTEMLYKSLENKEPVRVLRAAPKKANAGLYSPSVGIRYDGLYDVVRRTKAFNDKGGAY
ncbi:ydg sra domain-containing protein [Colletotrichum kahawae]|uniref:Ydg sra domain-containing protein n=1 Tax=Colletotrichum kahawae TaxID=34407 RepID=A0AAD9YY89_COLKA|nr:ydg sra domain-containing protein [Colletotrichum kahawae]